MRSTFQYKIFKPFQGSVRSAFTLIELVVVMGLIAVLASLTIYAVSAFQANARYAATEVLIMKLDSMVQQRRGDLYRYLKASDQRVTSTVDPAYVVAFRNQIANPNNGDAVNYSNGYGGGTAGRSTRIVFGRKLSYRASFPQKFSEFRSPPTMKTPGNHRPETESAEVLYHFLTNSSQFGGAAVEKGEFSDQEVADTDNDGLLEFVDAWGQPLRFYRWPTRLIRAQTSDPTQPTGDTRAAYTLSNLNIKYAGDLLIGNPPSPTTLAADPDDPRGFINQNLEDFEQEFHTAFTWHSPLIMSVGEDGENGLFEPSDNARHGHLAQPDPNNLGAIYDNISSLMLRAGGE
ncbi:MAG: type II secretion system protein [Planctomycetaceae bacterium]|nr:type II secretion system protein [Planctomycetaceae bacterium]